MILVAGAGATGAGIAYRLALGGASDVVLCDRGEVASGSTSRAMGGVRQQFATAAEVRLAQESIAFFAELGPPFFDQVGYLFLATTEAGLEALESRRAVQAALGVPVERVDPSFVEGLETTDVLGAVFCAEDGVADPAAVTRELVRRARELGVDVREHTEAEGLLDGADTARDRVRAVVGALWLRDSASSCRCARSAGSCSRRGPALRLRRACRWSSNPRAASTSGAAASDSSSRCRIRPRDGDSRRQSTNRSSTTVLRESRIVSLRRRDAASTRPGRGSTT